MRREFDVQYLLSDANAITVYDEAGWPKPSCYAPLISAAFVEKVSTPPARSSPGFTSSGKSSVSRSPQTDDLSWYVCGMPLDDTTRYVPGMTPRIVNRPV